MKPKAYIKLSLGVHHQKDVVLIQFSYNQDLINQVRKYPKARWSQSKKSWYVPSEGFDLPHFFGTFKAMAYYIDYSALRKPQEQQKMKKRKERDNELITLPPCYLEKLQQKRYSQNTIKTYCHYFREFQKAFMDKNLEDIEADEINAYILKLVQERDISISQQNQRINSIKFYYEKVLGKERVYYHIDRPRREKKLPDVLSKEEVGAMLDSTDNAKHKCIIALIYSSGLRRGELINLKLEDIDSRRMLIKIRGAKGKKDRYVQLARASLKLLREYYKEDKPAEWLLEGKRGKSYSATSIFNVVRDAGKRAGIKKRVYPHILRHSFATHHLEQGTDLRYIQDWLGHASSRTTEVYTHVSNQDALRFRNPLDDIMDGEK